MKIVLSILIPLALSASSHCSEKKQLTSDDITKYKNSDGKYGGSNPLKNPVIDKIRRLSDTLVSPSSMINKTNNNHENNVVHK